MKKKGRPVSFISGVKGPDCELSLKNSEKLKSSCQLSFCKLDRYTRVFISN